MSDATKFDQLWAQLAAAHARGQARQAELDAQRAHAPAPGDAYLWVPVNEYVLAWVVIGAHPTDAEFVYVVPADSYARAGLADVAVRDANAPPLFVRCGRGHWMRRADLDARRRFRVLDAHHVRRLQQKLRQIAHGPLDGSSAAWEDEADPDYRDWMANVTASVLGAMAQARRGPGVSSGFMMRGGDPDGAFAEEIALAAADFDTFPDPSAPAVEDLGTQLPFDGPGELWIVKEVTGVSVVFRPAPDTVPAEPPAAAATDATGAWRELVWELAPDRSAARAGAPWINQQVRLRVGTGASAREHTVTKF
jgi:hypothetical protein